MLDLCSLVTGDGKFLVSVASVGEIGSHPPAPTCAFELQARIRKRQTRGAETAVWGGGNSVFLGFSTKFRPNPRLVLDPGHVHGQDFRTCVACPWRGMNSNYPLRTESYDTMDPVDVDPRLEVFGPFNDYLLQPR